MKKFLFGLFGVILSVFLQNPVFAENFYIQNYNVNINVNENKTVDVIEDITVNFTNPSHGIFRRIPLIDASIKDISATELHSRNFNNSNLTLKLGNANRLVRGLKQYRIKYTYIIKDTKNEFYYNIIGTDWDTDIQNASFSVTMPKEFDYSKAGLSVGRYGKRGFNNTAQYQILGNTINGKITKPLAPREGITLRIEVPSGYFTNENASSNNEILVLSGIIILTLITLFIWFKVGKDEHVTPVVAFYPPKNINCVESEIVLKEKASEKSITALLIELAGKGYIQIKEMAEQSDFEIIKVKDYDGKNSIEKIFLKNLFENGQNSTSLMELQVSKTFYSSCQKLIDAANERRVLFLDKNSLNNSYQIVMSLCALGTLFLTLFLAAGCDFVSIFRFGPLILFPMIAISVFSANPKNLFVAIWALGFGGIPTLILFQATGFNFSRAPLVLFGAAAVVISIICIKQIAKRNKRGVEIASELLGLKKFIEVAEKHRLENLTRQNPEYFYKILPYAYLLGVCDQWIKQFESIMLNNPDWYCGQRFSTHSFNNLASNMQRASIPTTSNGGIGRSSSGGGGHSGGGHGGGGGGSW